MRDFLSISEKIEKAKALDFGDVLSRSFNLFKKTWSQGFLLVLIMILLMIPVFFVAYAPIYTTMVEQIQNGDFDPNHTSSLMLTQDAFRYRILGATFVASFMSTMLVAGFYRMIKRIDLGETHSFSDLFFFVKGKYLGKVFAIAAFSLLVAMVNFGLEKFLPPTIGSILSGLFSIIVTVYTTMFVVFFAFHPDLESSEIFSLGFNLGTKKWLLIFGLILITGIIAVVLSIITCGLGLLFVLSIIYLPPYLVYKDIIGFDTISDIDSIGIEENDLNS